LRGEVERESETMKFVPVEDSLQVNFIQTKL